ncbi:hypothetical protein [Capnocytophaga sputigena]|uniref:Uncharacterized protein n=1 Tax=Capnocytophaga sputigena TaxID=1019 RepID=A0ABM6ML95_CAPSP|nr:hypothetical protein [Capnocytophaga sputigena]ATA84690.1 hypothetical protein CGC55_09305 [Capnocytophaga sputigena]EEB65788.1 hypothetical protein CAPSP0001_0648 [Capnocytophaga sputigena ATCC 33612]
MKAQIEAQVVRWFWAAGGVGLFSLEPFYFEQNRFPKSKILKEAPKDTDNKYQYGVNEKDEIIVAHSYIGCEGDYYEEFYFREENQIISYHFDFASKKKCISTKIFIYKDELLQSIYSAFDNNTWSERTMYYEGNKLIRQEKKGIDYIDNTLLYTYDMSGKLNSITSETGYVYYQKKDKKISYKALSEKAMERYYALLVPTIKAYPIKEPLYCINLSFDYQNILPTRIGFGLESDRQKWNETYGERVDRYLWNTAEYAHIIDIEPNEEDATLFDLFNQETEMQEKSSAATKLLVACAKRLKEECASLGIPSTDDFVIVVGDEEEFFFKKV